MKRVLGRLISANSEELKGMEQVKPVRIGSAPTRPGNRRRNSEGDGVHDGFVRQTGGRVDADRKMQRAWALPKAALA